MGNSLPQLLERLHTDLDERMSVADDLVEDGETDISLLLEAQIDLYFEVLLPEVFLDWKAGRL